ncbi:ATP-binding protein [Sporosarcina siberiensis]|uniref:histidine kinase n=1 Tax=Sporosarcina siberiensis TaxID=1365606 RepID=A0ABW4SEB0_9BACL
MKKKNVIVVIGIYLLILLSLRISWFHFNSTYEYPHAKEGVLNLQGIDLNDDTVLSLDGEWLFYQNQIIDPKKIEIPLISQNNTLINVPENWEGKLANEEQSPFGYGTYRLKIVLDENQEEAYSFYFKEIRSSSTIFINGRKVAEQGRVAERADRSIQDFRPISVTIDGKTKEIDLIIHVSNFDSSRSGGIVKSIKFGKVSSVNKAQLIGYLFQIIIATILLLHCFYSLIIFFLSTRKIEMLYLSSAFFFAAASILLDDDKLILYLLPSIGFSLWFKLVYITYASGVFFVLQFFKGVLHQYVEGRKWLSYTYKILSISYVLLIASFILEINEITTVLFPIFMRLIPILISINIYKIMISSKASIIYFLLATISIASSIIWGSIKTNKLTSFSYYPFEIMFAVFFFAIYWFNEFIYTTKESEKLSLKLQKEIKRKDDFLANTSHELRNPLHGILNISQTILESEKDKLSNEGKNDLQLLLTIGRRMSMTLNDLLDISKLKDNGIVLKTTEVQLISVVNGVFDMLQFMKEGKNIVFVNEISNTFPKVIADENRLFQIIFNILHNAVKFTNEGEIVVTAEVKKKWAVIHIIDNGIGIDDETQDTIFKPYEQVDSGITSISGGIGLGLSICDQLVKLHGGVLSVKSRKGMGSTFTFTLPVGTSEVKESNLQTDAAVVPMIDIAERALRRNLNVERLRVLVVDDNPLNLAIVERILKAEKYEVFTCTSGKDALFLLDKGNWDLVISDVMMPNMSGYELTQKIRERFTLSELPILLLTARSQLEDLQTGFSSGANDYVRKPIEKMELTMRVEALTNIRESINERVRMEAAWLQAQIQPHFLFNTLNTIAALSEIDPPRMTELLDNFGTYLASSFTTQNLNQVIPLKDEIKLVQSYLYIEQQRFGERLVIDWDFDAIPMIEIPPLSIQTIVENAIRHGVLKRPEGGIITIRIVNHVESIEISVVDNGVGIAQEKLKDLLTTNVDSERGIGLLNTHKRLIRLYGKGLIITSSLNKGVSVRFNIPKGHL